MRILHVINSLHFGGAEKLLSDIIPEFKHQGLDVEVMVLYNEETFLFKELANRHGVKVIAPQKLRSLYSFSHLMWIRKHVKQYDIIHVHLFPTLYWVVLSTLLLKHNTKLVVTEHNTNNRRQSLPFLKYLDKFIYKRYDKIIAISEGVNKNLQSQLGKNHSTIEVINNGVNTSLFNEAIAFSKNELDLPEDAKIVIQVSSFFPQKDHDTLLKAISLLPEDIHLILVGYGLLINEKKELATSLKISKRVHFLGYRKDVAALLKMSDVCVLSSHYEGFGLSIVEGMAAGIPCVGSNVDGLSQVIGDAGVLFEKGNYNQLKDILHQLFSNKEHYDQISKQCLGRSRKYDISLMINAHLKMYNRIAK